MRAKASTASKVASQANPWSMGWSLSPLAPMSTSRAEDGVLVFVKSTPVKAMTAGHSCCGGLRRSQGDRHAGIEDPCLFHGLAEVSWVAAALRANWAKRHGRKQAGEDLSAIPTGRKTSGDRQGSGRPLPHPFEVNEAPPPEENVAQMTVNVDGGIHAEFLHGTSIGTVLQKQASSTLYEERVSLLFTQVKAFC